MTAHSLSNSLARFPQIRRLAWRAGRTIYAAARGDNSSDDIATNGEGYVQSCVLRAIPEDTALRMIDIGGNQGDWSCEVLRQLSPRRRAEASIRIDTFEPAPGPLARLKAALAKTGLETLCHVHQMAVSDVEGTVTIGIMSEHGGTNSIHFEHDTSAKVMDRVTVEAMPLSTFCSSNAIAHLHLVKCDTEGHDFAVLKGAADLFRQQQIDVMQFEYGHRWIFARTYLRDVFALLEGLPYRVARVQTDSIEVFEAWHPEMERFFQSNYLVVSNKAIGWFNGRAGRFDGANTYA